MASTTVIVYLPGPFSLPADALSGPAMKEQFATVLTEIGERNQHHNLRELVQLLHNRSCASLGAVMNCGERRGGRRL